MLFDWRDKLTQEQNAAWHARQQKEFDPNEPRDESGKWTTGGGSGDGGSGDTTGSIKPPSAEATAKNEGYEFVSSNTGNLDLKGAYEALASPRHVMLTTASKEIDAGLGLHADDHDAIGAWSDGAEDTMMTVVHGATWDQIVAGAAMKGYLGDQKAVLAFQQQEGGTAALAKWTTAGTYDDLESVHDELLKDGLAFHTLVAGPKGLTVYVADLDGSLAPAINKAAARYDSKVEIQFGRAEFIGTNKSDGTDRQQRDSARSVYETVIKQSPVQGSAEVWNRIHNRWGEALDPANQHFERGVNGEPSAALVAFAKAESEKELPKAGIVGRVPGDPVSGYLTPDGTLININDYHSEVAEAAGTTLDDLLKDGSARIYYYPGDYVGVEMRERPTAQEVNTLKSAVSRGRVPKLYIDHQLWRSQFRGGFEAKPGLTVRPNDLIQAINKVMPAPPKDLSAPLHRAYVEKREEDDVTEVELWPEDDEDREEFLDRCVEAMTPCIGEDNAVDTCTSKWTAARKLGKKGFITIAELEGFGFRTKLAPCGIACLACGEDQIQQKFDESQHPRDESGKWTDGGGGSGGEFSAGVGPKVTSGKGATPEAVSKVNAAISSIPKAHAERIKDVPIQVVHSWMDVPRASMFTIGTFQEKPPKILIPSILQVYGIKGTREVPVNSLGRSAVHEIGHALDHNSGWKHTDAINTEVVRGSIRLTKKERKDAGYYLTDPKEAFAELYSLAYLPKAQDEGAVWFGSLTRERAETAFADALAKVKAIQ